MSERNDGGPNLVSPAKIKEACKLLGSMDTWQTLCLISMANAPDGCMTQDAIDAADKFVDELKSTLGLIQCVCNGDVYFAGADGGELQFSLTKKGRTRGKAMLRAREVKP